MISQKGAKKWWSQIFLFLSFAFCHLNVREKSISAAISLRRFSWQLNWDWSIFIGAKADAAAAGHTKVVSSLSNTSIHYIVRTLDWLQENLFRPKPCKKGASTLSNYFLFLHFLDCHSGSAFEEDLFDAVECCCKNLLPRRPTFPSFIGRITQEASLSKSRQRAKRERETKLCKERGWRKCSQGKKKAKED